MASSHKRHLWPESTSWIVDIGPAIQVFKFLQTTSGELKCFTSKGILSAHRQKLPNKHTNTGHHLQEGIQKRQEQDQWTIDFIGNVFQIHIYLTKPEYLYKDADNVGKGQGYWLGNKQ